MIGKSDFYAIGGLIVATFLFLAVGNWPYGYYQFVRIATCGFSIAIVLRSDRPSAGGWLLFSVAGAILFNPIFPIRMEKGDWGLADLVFGIGYGAYGMQSMSRSIAKASSFLIWIVLAIVMSLTFYVNHYMPHGPSYPTGDIVCQNDDRGPCGEEYREDMTGLDIPDWAKTLRENFAGLVMLLIVAGICGTAIAKGDDAE